MPTVRDTCQSIFVCVLTVGAPGERYQVVVHVRRSGAGGPRSARPVRFEEGYQVDRQPDGALRFQRPDGRPLPEVPAPVAMPADPVQPLQARHDAQGLRPHARTACPAWLGERLDVGWAIDVLHPLATRGARSRPSPENRGSSAASSSAVVLAAAAPLMPE